MQWAVVVSSLKDGQVLFSENASKLMMPASNMKVVTLAATAERLGWDFTFETRLMSVGTIDKGVLKGDLVVVGGGDPTFNGRGGAATRTFDSWAEQLERAGIRRIEGRVVADGRAFPAETLGAGWAWDYLTDYYAAGVSALQFNENVADIAIRPGSTPQAPAIVEMRPPESGLVVENQVTTTARGDVDIDVHRYPGSSRLVVSGKIPVGTKEIVRSTAVDRPVLYFANVLRSVLIAKGIEITGGARDIADLAGEPVPSGAELKLLLSHHSAPLSDVAKPMMKASQNLYAETFLRRLGTENGGDGSAEAGQKFVRGVLTAWGVPEDAYVLVDGSGLSRYNYICADMMVTVLRHLYEDPKHREAFIATLPIGGVDGTLSRRFVNMKAANNVRAKTGSIANTRALSGFVTTADGEPLVFSILANSFTVPQSTIDASADQAVDRLASFSRR